MVRKLAGLAANLALSGAVLVGCLILLEFVVFRYILVPDDVLPNVTINSVVRYEPGRNATFRFPDGSTTRVTINAQGWNSRRESYAVEKTAGTKRIAVIGDSYVHNKFVETGESFTALLEDNLNAGGETVEVFRFGMDGAPLSQYLHVLRAEVLKYRPDVVVVPLIHNDFDESYRALRTRTGSSFMKLERGAEACSVSEIPPRDFKPGLADRLRTFATFRYLYYETNLYLYAKDWISRLYWGGSDQWDPTFISSAVDIRNIKDHDSNAFFARYVLSAFQDLSRAHGFQLLFFMDGVREAVYESREAKDYEVGRLNEIARAVTADLQLPYFDLQPAFAEDYAAHGERFEFSYDWHWNVRANRLIADELTKRLVPMLSGVGAATATDPVEVDAVLAGRCGEDVGVGRASDLRSGG